MKTEQLTATIQLPEEYHEYLREGWKIKQMSFNTLTGEINLLMERDLPEEPRITEMYG